MEELDHYHVLGLNSGEESSTLTEKEISIAYRKKALELHPDKHPNDPNAHARFQKLQFSYEVLKEPKARKEFDDLLRVRREKKFFPKTEKYVSLFCGDDNTDLVDKRNGLRKQIKANIVAAAASGKDLEETGSEDDGLADLSDDDFFLSGSSSDEADADDELTDLSAREQASSASGKAASGLSSDERNQLMQKQNSARSLMPPLHPQKSTRRNFSAPQNTIPRRDVTSYSRGCSNSQTGQSSNLSSNSGAAKRFSNIQTSQSSNLSSNSDAPKRKRKRRPKKLKQ